MGKLKLEIVEKLEDFFYPARYKLAYGGRGGGKSYTIALLLILKAIKEPLRILCTREIQRSIKDSVHKLLNDLIIKYKFDKYLNVKRDTIDGINGSEFIFKGLFRNITEIKSTEGIDICWVEEAQSVSMESLEILDPTVRKEKSEIWFTLNRYGDNDPVWQRYVKKPRPRTKIIKVNYYDNIFCTKESLEQAEYDKKTDIVLYNHIWEGEPLVQVEDAVITRHDVMKAMERQLVDDNGAICVGVDVARFGDDRTVFCKRKGFKTLDYRIYRKKDTFQTTNYLCDFINHDKSVILNIDDTGIGGALTDNMRHKGYKNVNPINNGGVPKNKNKYPNIISEMWFEFADIIDKVSLLKSDKLKEELSNRKYGYDKQQRKVIESKDQYKKRNHESPDEADAMLLAYYIPKKNKVNIFMI